MRQDHVIAKTRKGKIRAIRKNGVNIYKAVSYAGPASGEYRFRSPGPLESCTGIRDALQLGPPSIQMPNQTYGINETETTEDCLFLVI